MEIKRIDVFHLGIPLTIHYHMSGGRVMKHVDTTIVKLTTQSGVIGWGESCPWGPNYLPGHGRGVRAGLEELAPTLIGLNSIELDKVNEVMDKNLAGHGYVKHAVDMACWDAFGKSVNLPLSVLLGGIHQTKLNCVASVPCGDPETTINTVNTFRKNGGYKFFSCKLSGDVNNDLPSIDAVMQNAASDECYIFDANMGLNLADALRCARFLEKYDVIFEQPTKTYEEFYALRQRCNVPMMIDEIFTGMETMWRIIKDKSCEMINLKIAKVGGLSKARLIRDVCLAHGMPLSIQCCGGSEISRAAIMHLAQSTRPGLMHCIWDCAELNSFKVVTDAHDVESGTLKPSGLPGLGVEPDIGVLGQPVATYK